MTIPTLCFIRFGSLQFLFLITLNVLLLEYSYWLIITTDGMYLPLNCNVECNVHCDMALSLSLACLNMLSWPT